MKASARPFFGGSITMNWSQPTPVWRSATAPRLGIAQRQRLRPRIDDDEVVAQPVHLDEGRPLMGGL